MWWADLNDSPDSPEHRDDLRWRKSQPETAHKSTPSHARGTEGHRKEATVWWVDLVGGEPAPEPAPAVPQTVPPAPMSLQCSSCLATLPVSSFAPKQARRSPAKSK